MRWPVPWATFIFGEAQMDTGHWPSFAGKQRSYCPVPRGCEGVVTVSLVPDLGSHCPVCPRARGWLSLDGPSAGHTHASEFSKHMALCSKALFSLCRVSLRENVLPPSTLTSLPQDFQNTDVTQPFFPSLPTTLSLRSLSAAALCSINRANRASERTMHLF